MILPVSEKKCKRILLLNCSRSFHGTHERAPNMKKNTIWTNTALLVASNIFVRILGLGYKVWLSRTLTAESLGIYQLSMTVYMLFITPIASGLPNVISRLSASCMARGENGAARGVLRRGLKIAGCVALLSGAVMFCCAPMLSSLILKNSTAWIVVLALIPGVVLGGVGAVPCGYLHAAGHSGTNALSEALEQSVKILSVVLLFHVLQPQGVRLNDVSAAALAAAGISVGGIFSYVFIRWRTGSLRGAVSPVGSKRICLSAAPLTANRLIGSLAGMITASLVPHCLLNTGMSSAEALAAYGVLTGMALPIVFLPSTVTSAISVVLLPNIAKTRAASGIRAAEKKINRVLFYVFLMGVPAALLICVIAMPLGRLLYRSVQAGQYMLMLAPSTLFSGLNQVGSTILNALGREGKTFKINLASALISLLLTFLLTPVLGIPGYILATTIQGVLTFGMVFFSIRRSLAAER